MRKRGNAVSARIDDGTSLCKGGAGRGLLKRGAITAAVQTLAT
jgi:hypothetical protein